MAYIIIILLAFVLYLRYSMNKLEDKIRNDKNNFKL